MSPDIDLRLGTSMGKDVLVAHFPQSKLRIVGMSSKVL